MIIKETDKTVRRKRAFLVLALEHYREGYGKEEEGDIFILNHLTFFLHEIHILLKGILRYLLVNLANQLLFVILSMKFSLKNYFSHRNINIQIITEQGKDTVILLMIEYSLNMKYVIESSVMNWKKTKLIGNIKLWLIL